MLTASFAILAGIAGTGLAEIERPYPYAQSRMFVDCPTPIGAYQGYLVINVVDNYGNRTFLRAIDVGSNDFCQQQAATIVPQKASIDQITFFGVCRPLIGGFEMDRYSVDAYGTGLFQQSLEYKDQATCFAAVQEFNQKD
jgi:hypothetical protein